MGSTVCEAVGSAAGTELVAAVDPSGTGAVSAGSGRGEIPISADPEVLVEAGVEVAVDFTNTESAIANMRFCSAHGIHLVSGTTGLSPIDVDEMRTLFPGTDSAGGSIGDGGGGSASSANCIWAPNFAIGAVVMFRLAEIAAAHLDAVEVIELHHDGKRDAPSGTAIETARRMTEARTAAGKGEWPADPTVRQTVPGARGAAAAGEVHIHSVRLPGLVAHQEVIFGAPGQTLSIRHDSYDRVSFMPGVMTAVSQVSSRPGLTIGLGELLGL
jgi:4-hydroxy-tetrahydrodipicolinate reductase